MTLSVESRGVNAEGVLRLFVEESPQLRLSWTAGDRVRVNQEINNAIANATIEEVEEGDAFQPSQRSRNLTSTEVSDGELFVDVYPFRVVRQGRRSVWQSRPFAVGQRYQVEILTITNQRRDSLWITLSAEDIQSFVPPADSVQSVDRLPILRRSDMSFVNMQRDAQFTELGAAQAFATGERNGAGGPSPRTDGMVRETLAHLRLAELPLAVATVKNKSAGVYLRGPDTRAPDWTPYRCVGQVWSPHALAFGYGVVNAGPAATATGVNLAHYVITDIAPAQTPLHIDRLVVVKPFGTISNVDYRSRPIQFFVMAYNLTSAAVSGPVIGSVDIQRLVSPPPQFIDRRIG